jgi:hypothetical protein
VGEEYSKSEEDDEEDGGLRPEGVAVDPWRAERDDGRYAW